MMFWALRKNFLYEEANSVVKDGTRIETGLPEITEHLGKRR